MVVNRIAIMGNRAGGGARGGAGGGARAPTAGQIKAAHEQYKKAKAGYDAAAQALNNAVKDMRPGGPKVDIQKVQAKFHKASNRLDKAHSKWSKLKTAKKIADYKAANP